MRAQSASCKLLGVLCDSSRSSSLCCCVLAAGRLFWNTHNTLKRVHLTACVCVCLCAHTQVNDISQLGTPIEVAQLILPRGSTLLATATQQVPVPPKTTPVGQVELPPQTYFR